MSYMMGKVSCGNFGSRCLTAVESKPAIPTAGSSGRVSKCESHRDFIERRLELGLSAQRIWQDHRDETGFAGSYESVMRFVRKIEAKAELPHRRMETPPVVDPDGTLYRKATRSISLSSSVPVTT
jgi:hypothetical protein